jgi:hypothetical protein
MIFVGYEVGSKAYRAYDPCTRCVHVTHDVVFDKLAQWDWGEGSGTHGEINTEPFKIEFITTTEYQMVSGVNQAKPE